MQVMHGGHQILLTLFCHGIVAHDHPTFQTGAWAAAYMLITVVRRNLTGKTRLHTALSTARTNSSPRWLVSHLWGNHTQNALRCLRELSDIDAE